MATLGVAQSSLADQASVSPKKRIQTHTAANELIWGLKSEIKVKESGTQAHAYLSGEIPAVCAKHFDIKAAEIVTDPAHKSDATKNTVTFSILADRDAKACVDQAKGKVDCIEDDAACVQLMQLSRTDLSSLNEYEYTIRFLESVSRDDGEATYSHVVGRVGNVAKVRKEILTQAATTCKVEDGAAAVSQYNQLISLASQIQDHSLATALENERAARVASDKDKVTKEILERLKAELEAVASLEDYDKIDRIGAELKALRAKDIDAETRKEVDALIAGLTGKRIRVLNDSVASAKELEDLEKIQKYAFEAIKPGATFTINDKKEVEKVLNKVGPKITAKLDSLVKKAKDTDELDAVDAQIAAAVTTQRKFNRKQAEKTERLHEVVATRGVTMVENKILRMKPEKDEDGASFIARVEDAEAQGLEWVDNSESVSPTARARLLAAAADKKANAPAEDISEAIDNVRLAEETLADACANEGDCDRRLELSVNKRIANLQRKRGFAEMRTTGQSSTLSDLWESAQANRMQSCYGISKGSFLGMDAYSHSNNAMSIEDSIACANANETLRDLSQMAANARQAQQPQRGPFGQGQPGMGAPLDPLAGTSMPFGQNPQQAAAMTGFPAAAASYNGMPSPLALANASNGIMGSNPQNPFATMSML
ncbi:MAG: hypothetical protein AB7P04_01410 [Bacteriovoracia bacterium]